MKLTEQNFRDLVHGRVVIRGVGVTFVSLSLEDMDFNAMERALHDAVEASGWCLHCFINGVGGPGEGCAVEVV